MKIQEKILLNSLKAEIDPVFNQRAKFIFNQVFKYQPKSVLDVGCGRGFYSNSLAQLPYIREIAAIDLRKEHIKKAISKALNTKVKYFTENIFNWSSTKKYDLIIVSEVLEHVGDEEAFLKKIYTLLKKNGKLIITVPCADYPFFWDPINYFLKFFNTHVNKDKWFLAGIWADHERLYNKLELSTTVSRANFKQVSLFSAVSYCWPFSHLLLYGIGKNLVLKFNIDSVDRFNTKPKPLAKVIATFFALPEEIMLNFNNERNKAVGLMGLWFK